MGERRADKEKHTKRWTGKGTVAGDRQTAEKPRQLRVRRRARERALPPVHVTQGSAGMWPGSLGCYGS